MVCGDFLSGVLLKVAWDEKDIKTLFNKEIFEERFNSGMSPKEAFEEEMFLWADCD